MPTARRITGRHLVLEGPGAVLDVPHDDAARVLQRARDGLRALGWPVEVRLRTHRVAATVGLHAPVDGVDAAVELLEWAAADEGDFDEVVRTWRETQDPAWRRLAAAFPGLVVEGEGLVTVGFGRSSRSWPRERTPSPAEVGNAAGIPIVTITGTNGKTTTTRLVAHCVEAAGRTAGRTSSDAVVIGDDTVERGDWTGPGAARRVLRDPRVAVAVLETARGGILRRGLAVEGADVAVLTNVTPEHLGEWGVDDLETMAWTKLTLARGLRQGGTLVVPAVSGPIDAVLPRLRAMRPDLRLRTFASRPLQDPVPSGWADDRFLHVGDGVVPLDEIPITFWGTARHNVENALCAALAALALGVPPEAVGRGLRTFRPSVADNPGRMNTFRMPSGALVVLDFAHNADGIKRITETVRRWPRSRRILLLGQAGDRTDEDLVAMAAESIPLDAWRIVLKEVPKRLYDRAPGEVSAILQQALLQRGVPPSVLVGPTPDEATGVHLAVRNAGPDDVVVLLIHETLVGAVAVLEQYGAVPVG
jgi:UDP-N-acetylmuramyl tripeptide synthase